MWLIKSFSQMSGEGNCDKSSKCQDINFVTLLAWRAVCGAAPGAGSVLLRTTRWGLFLLISENLGCCFYGTSCKSDRDLSDSFCLLVNKYLNFC